MKSSLLRLRGALVVAPILLALGGMNGCSFIVDTNERQCETNTDCSVATAGALFEGYVCGPRNSCVRSAEYCFTNSECIDANGGVENFVCNKKTHGCVNLFSKQCPRLQANPGDLRNDDAILVGLDWGSQFSEELKMAEDALSLARSDFATQVQGVPRANGEGASRPVVTVVCDPSPSDTTPDLEKVIVDHLFDTADVKVMIGPLFDKDVVYAVNRAVKLDKYVLTPHGVSEALQAIPGYEKHAALVGPSAEFQYAAYGKIFNLQKAKLTDGNIKVALVSPSDADSANTVPFLKSLVYNGKTAIENKADGKFDYIQFGDDGASEKDPAFNDALARLNAIKPDIIACRGITCLGVLSNYEKANPDQARWILGFESWQLFDFGTYAKTDVSRQRFLGLNVRRPESDERWQKFLFYMGPKFPDDGLTDLGGYLYDLGYLTHLTFAAIGDAPITGTAFHDALLSKFKVPVAGPAVITTPTKIRDLIQTLRTNPPLSAGGAQLDFDFEASGGLTNPPAEVWCVGKPGSAHPNKVTSTGLVYNKRDNSITGTNTCF